MNKKYGNRIVAAATAAALTTGAFLLARLPDRGLTGAAVGEQT